MSRACLLVLCLARVVHGWRLHVSSDHMPGRRKAEGQKPLRAVAFNSPVSTHHFMSKPGIAASHGLPLEGKHHNSKFAPVATLTGDLTPVEHPSVIEESGQTKEQNTLADDAVKHEELLHRFNVQSLGHFSTASSVGHRVSRPILATASAPGRFEPTLQEWMRRLVTSNAIMPMLALYAINAALMAVLTRAGITFPASVCGLFVVFFSLLLLNLWRPRAAARVEAFFDPACQLVRTWLAAIFAPGFIALPLTMPALRALDVVTFLLLLGVGLVSSTATNVAIAAFLEPRNCIIPETGENVCVTTEAFSDDVVVEAPPISPANPFPPAQQLALGVSFVACGAIYLITRARSPLILNLGLLSATLGSFSLMSTLCSPSVKIWFHPFVSCSMLTWVAVAALASMSGQGWKSVLQLYAATSGAGGWLLQLIGPTVLSFAFSLYRFRVQLRERLPQVLGTAIAGSLVSLFTGAAAARALGLAPVLRIALLSRSTLSALAMETSRYLGGEPALATLSALVTALLGISFGKQILLRLGVEDPVIRGLALGGSAHGGATLCLADDPEAFPFAALMMSLGGACTVALLSLSPVRSLLMTVALGR